MADVGKRDRPDWLLVYIFHTSVWRYSINHFVFWEIRWCDFSILVEEIGCLNFRNQGNQLCEDFFHSLNESSLENGFDMSYRTLVRQLNRAFWLLLYSNSRRCIPTNISEYCPSAAPLLESSNTNRRVSFVRHWHY